jgi:uncharacterized protein (DUF433 family)
MLVLERSFLWYSYRIMSLKISYPHISKDSTICGGKACIKSTRIRVLDIVTATEHLALSPDEVCNQYPELTLAQVHCALAYYYDHREEVQAEIKSEREVVDKFQRDHPDQVAP